MANQEYLDILKQGMEIWNQWRDVHQEIRPDLRKANLKGADLRGANLSDANLKGADLSDADLRGANLSDAYLNDSHLWDADLSDADLRGAHLNDADLWGAHLSNADLREADLSDANLRRADLKGADLNNANFRDSDLRDSDLSEAILRGADLRGADLSEADLRGADLSEATLMRTILVKTNLEHANLTGCSIYGISVWDVQLSNATQSNLIITDKGEPTITVDNLQIAQFIYLLLKNKEIREIIDTIAKKAVLILGRFTPERKAVLDALREALRIHGYLPILFDFEKPSSRNMTETVSTLAHLSRFIIADLTDPSSIPQELYAIVPMLAIAVQPVLLEGKKEYAMSIDLLSTYHWMLPIHFYKDQADLLATLKEDVIKPAEQKAKELEKR
jgi:uncharacterized protein YjbI with pentapeptide repeats